VAQHYCRSCGQGHVVNKSQAVGDDDGQAAFCKVARKHRKARFMPNVMEYVASPGQPGSGGKDIYTAVAAHKRGYGDGP